VIAPYLPPPGTGFRIPRPSSCFSTGLHDPLRFRLAPRGSIDDDDRPAIPLIRGRDLPRGPFFTRYADAIAELTGLGRLLVGSILLAGATSLPEQSVDISAVRLGETDMAVGDLMGSSLMNLLILGLMDLLTRTRGCEFSPASTAHVLSATLSIVLTVVAALSMLLGKDSGTTVLGLGLGSWAPLVSYVLGVRMIHYDQRVSASAAETDQEVRMPAGKLKLTGAILGFCVAALVIVVTSPFLARTAAEIADRTGLGGRLSERPWSPSVRRFRSWWPRFRPCEWARTTWPWATSSAATALTWCCLSYSTCSIRVPSSRAGPPPHVLTCLATLMITSVAILGQLYRNERRIVLVEPDTVLIVGLIVVALAMVYHVG
jgi:cation:H+ antiporter